MINGSLSTCHPMVASYNLNVRGKWPLSTKKTSIKDREPL